MSRWVAYGMKLEGKGLVTRQSHAVTKNFFNAVKSIQVTHSIDLPPADFNIHKKLTFRRLSKLDDRASSLAIDRQGQISWQSGCVHACTLWKKLAMRLNQSSICTTPCLSLQHGLSSQCALSAELGTWWILLFNTPVVILACSLSNSLVHMIRSPMQGWSLSLTSVQSTRFMNL